MEIDKKLFEKGLKFTVFSISSCLAMTTEAKIKTRGMKSQSGLPAVSYDKGRKMFSMPTMKNDDCLIFEGWDLPICSDGEMKPTRKEGSAFESIVTRGNACLNLHAESKEVLKDYIENKNINPFFDSKELVVFSSKDGKEEVLYPELCSNHAVINDIKKNV